MPTENQQEPDAIPDINTISPDEARLLGGDYPVPEGCVRNFSFLACPPGNSTAISSIAHSVRDHQAQSSDATHPHLFYAPKGLTLPFTHGPSECGVYVNPTNEWNRSKVYTSARQEHGVRNPSGTGNSRAIASIFSKARISSTPSSPPIGSIRSCFGDQNIRGVIAVVSACYIADRLEIPYPSAKSKFAFETRIGNLTWAKMEATYKLWEATGFDPEVIPKGDMTALMCRGPAGDLPRYSMIPVSRLYKVVRDNPSDLVAQYNVFKQWGIALTSGRGAVFSSSTDGYPALADPESLGVYEIYHSPNTSTLDGADPFDGDQTELQFRSLAHLQGSTNNTFVEETYASLLPDTKQYAIKEATGLRTYVNSAEVVAIRRNEGSQVDTGPNNFHVAHSRSVGPVTPSTDRVALHNAVHITFILHFLTSDSDQIASDHTHTCRACISQYITFSANASRCPVCNHCANDPLPTQVVHGYQRGPRSYIKHRYDKSIKHPLINYTIGFEVEKNYGSISGTHIGGKGAVLPDAVPFLPVWETDASCGLEAISHTYSLGDPNPFYEDVNASREVIDGLPANSQCGGHLSIKGPNVSPTTIRHYVGLVYSLYYGRINNTYCCRNLKTRNKAAKYGMTKFRANDFVEFRLISGVKNSDQLLWRYLFFQRFMLAVHEGWSFDRLLNHTRPLLKEVYTPARLQAIVKRARRFDNYLNHGEVHQDIEDLVIGSIKDDKFTTSVSF